MRAACSPLRVRSCNLLSVAPCRDALNFVAVNGTVCVHPVLQLGNVQHDCLSVVPSQPECPDGVRYVSSAEVVSVS